MPSLVSIIIPAYNRPDELSHSINSVLKQSYDNLEIIIVDDCSSLDLKNIVEKFKDNRIQYFKREKNLGVTESRKFGIQISKGDYIGFLDDDDYLEPNCIQDKMEVVLQSSDLNLVISDYKENNLITKIQTYHNMQSFYTDFSYEIFKRPGPFFQCCLFKSELLEDYNSLFDKNAIPSEDWDFFINLSNKNLNIGYINKSHFTWKFSNKSQSSNYTNEAVGLKYILKKHRNLFFNRVGKSIYSDHHRMVARVFEKSKDILNAKKNYQLAFKINPIDIKNILYLLISNLNDKSFIQLVSWMRTLRKTIFV